MQNSDNKNLAIKIIPVTLKMLPDIFRASERFYKSYKNCCFQYISFVARVIIPSPNLHFSDETGILGEGINRRQYQANYELGSYYQCLCKMKIVESSWKLQIVNRSKVEGNCLTTHMIRVITNQINRKGRQIEKYEQQRRRQQRQQQKQEQLYWAMRQWMEKTEKFTVQQLQQQFALTYDRNQCNRVLSRIQDEQLVGFMGNYYQWVGVQ